MNDNSIKIESYLQNEMSAEERAAFEALLIAEPELQYELQVQRSIAMAAYNAGLKQAFAKVIRKRMLMKKVISWGIVIVILTGAALLYLFKYHISHSMGEDSPNIEGRNSAIPFINPPLKSIDVPFDEYEVNADAGDTIFAPSGSVVLFPPAAFTDESGNIVKGKVKVRFREFTRPVDFFVSGITMAYDSAGRRYNFESSGMCEINAYQNDKALFVNPSAKPEIFLSATNKSPLHNLYYLDTLKRNWVFEGKDTIEETKNMKENKLLSSPPILEDANMGNVSDYDLSEPPVKPLKPIKASDDHQSFSIAIDPGSFDELLAYDKLKFEVIDESTYKRSDADEHWDNVVLSHGNAEGIYTVTFSNKTRKVSYKVRPVLEGEDYAAAMKLFNEKNKAYEQARKGRLTREKNESDSVTALVRNHDAKVLALQKENDRINAVIMARNRNMRQLQSQLIQIAGKLAKEEEKRLGIIEQNKSKFQKDLDYSNEIIRSFSINQFGIWNCDHPQYPAAEEPLIANYVDSSNKPLLLSSVAVVYKNVNGITQYTGSAQIRFMKGADNMVWGIRDSALYYFTYQDFKAAGIQSGTAAFTF